MKYVCNLPFNLSCSICFINHELYLRYHPSTLIQRVHLTFFVVYPVCIPESEYSIINRRVLSLQITFVISIMVKALRSPIYCQNTLFLKICTISVDWGVWTTVCTSLRLKFSTGGDILRRTRSTSLGSFAMVFGPIRFCICDLELLFQDTNIGPSVLCKYSGKCTRGSATNKTIKRLYMSYIYIYITPWLPLSPPPNGKGNVFVYEITDLAMDVY